MSSHSQLCTSLALDSKQWLRLSEHQLSYLYNGATARRMAAGLVVDRTPRGHP